MVSKRKCPHNRVRLLKRLPSGRMVFECLDCGAEVRRERP